VIRHSDKAYPRPGAKAGAMAFWSRPAPSSSLTKVRGCWWSTAASKQSVIPARLISGRSAPRWIPQRDLFVLEGTTPFRIQLDFASERAGLGGRALANIGTPPTKDRSGESATPGRTAQRPAELEGPSRWALGANWPGRHRLPANPDRGAMLVGLVYTGLRHVAANGWRPALPRSIALFQADKYLIILFVATQVFNCSPPKYPNFFRPIKEGLWGITKSHLSKIHREISQPK